MKKYLLKVLTICVLSLSIISTSTQNSSANTNFEQMSSSIIYNTDESYDIEVVYSNTPEKSLLIAQYSNTETKSFTKMIKHYDKNDNLCWVYTLKATFNVNKGVSAKYKTSTASLEIQNNNYLFYSEHHDGSNNKATGTIKIKHNNTISSNTTTITCTKYGNFK